ncbi:MAG: TraX family protein [Acetatifactor sp.]
MKQKKWGISGSTLKIIAMTAMLIDHIAAAVFTRILICRGYFGAVSARDMGKVCLQFMDNEALYLLVSRMRMIGRIGFPLFCFLLVEGFQKTGNRKKYILRLGIFALISEIPFDLAFAGKVFDFSGQNVYFTLLIGMLFMCACTYVSKLRLPGAVKAVLVGAGILLLPVYYVKRYTSLVTKLLEPFLVIGGELGLIHSRTEAFWFVSFCLAAVLFILWLIYRRVVGPDAAWGLGVSFGMLTLGMLLGDLMKTDYGGSGVLTIAVMYFLRGGRILSGLGGCTMLNITHTNEVTAYLALIPIAYYNGERGLKLKYLFYAFYPVHLLVLWGIAAAMGMGWMAAL